MKDILTDYRMTTQAVQKGLFKLLLTLILASASLPAFSGRNIPPVISGTPATSVVAGSSYNFQPTASDANGNRLRFKISHKPAWASFSSTTGRLSGKPASSSVGTYTNIVISVSDGKVRRSLPAFNIQVVATNAKTGTSSTGTTSTGTTSTGTTSTGTTSTGTTSTGSLTLNWKAPVKRADGTPLSLADINGYHIHYGKSAGNYASQVNLADGTAQKVTLTGLAPGTYYLVMSTYDVNGRESGYSSAVSKNVQ